MPERAERVDFVPVSLDAGDVAWTPPGRPLAAFRPGRSSSPGWVASESFGSAPVSQTEVPLPDSPAMVCAGGVVVQANPAAAQLAGRWLPDSLIGVPLHRLL
ncbi:MAG: hypothetical protein M3319_10920, partial [Actinomycetota bacterium]|nr:hypothetical protein [Actinomycetota bacterium]MDQ3900913.1 hypothetical protein [Actinomycetota bacterium]